MILIPSRQFRRISRRHCVLLLLLSILPAVMTAQVYPDSPVYRGYRERPSRQDGRAGEGLREQINVFLLERDAAAGDPLAQHELGVRLLTGKGIAPDTTRAAEWIGRAAVQRLTPAMYNYGLLYLYGHGVDWNPFIAYRYFRAAAERGMSEAQHLTGIFFTDDLVLPRNWDSAAVWISRAAAADYPPAVKAKRELVARGVIPAEKDSLPSTDTADPRATTADPSTAGAGPAAGGSDPVLAAWAPVLLDFTRTRKTEAVETGVLLEELLASRDFSAMDSLTLSTLLGTDPDPGAIAMLDSMARWTNPEAMVLAARLRVEGRHVPRDVWWAAEMLASAVFLESARAPGCLVELLRDGGLSPDLFPRAWNGDARAQYLLACLKFMNIETRVTDAQARELLERAAARQSAGALTQLGIGWASGRWGAVDTDAAETAWEQAARLGSLEARLRLAASRLFRDEARGARAEALTTLDHGARQGSLLAAVAIAGSIERGIGHDVDVGRAVRRYRDAAVRGSTTAWRALLRLHDARRPDTPEFQLQ
ncbi:MAG: hypothetical protein RBU27_01370 [Bacteroidota bacterium]|nr:hypothetical protein [Bacteroidota bacterium]